MLRIQYDNDGDGGNKMFSSTSKHHPFTTSTTRGTTTGGSGSAHSILFPLSAAVGLVNHHDAITGTSKQVGV